MRTGEGTGTASVAIPSSSKISLQVSMHASQSLTSWYGAVTSLRGSRNALCSCFVSQQEQESDGVEWVIALPA